MKTKLYWVALLASAVLIVPVPAQAGVGRYDTTIAAHAQEQLARRRYYRGEVDGIVGPETRRAIMRYQSDHDLSVTGRLDMDMLHALGLPRVASN
jgi:peptidoglycan hydrolase-like protein with peptidoglycan-binding domain